MSLIQILRIEQTQYYSIGVISVDSVTKCFCLEPPKKGNQTDISCIPPGIYRTKKYKSPKFKRICLALYDVFDRDYVCVHPGNKTFETKACILPGLSRQGVGINTKVLSSNKALDEILRHCEDVNKLIIKEI